MKFRSGMQTYSDAFIMVMDDMIHQQEHHTIQIKKVIYMKKIISIVISVCSVLPYYGFMDIYAQSENDQLWDKFIRYDLCITDYNSLTDEKKELCHFIFDTEQASNDTIVCERARRTLANDSNIGDRLNLEQINDCYGICDHYADFYCGNIDYFHCVPDIKHLDGFNDYNEYWLDDEGNIKVFSTGENSGTEKTVYTVDIASVNDASVYENEKNMHQDKLVDGTYHVQFEIDRKKLDIIPGITSTYIADDGNEYYNFSDLENVSHYIIHNGDLYRITQNGDAALVKSKYAICSLYNEDIQPVNDIIEIPEKVNGHTVTSIDSYAFLNSFVTSVKLPSTILRIGTGAFSRCSKLKEINFPESLEYIGTRSFDSSGLTNLNIESQELVIAFGAFGNCGKLTDVYLNSRIVNERMFINCESLKNVTLGDSTEKVCANAFAGCESLERINFSKSVKTIGAGAFNDYQILNSGLKSVVIPPTVEVIGALPKQQGIGATSGIEVKATHPLTDESSCVFRGDCTVYGYSGTEAERYAEEWGLEFVPLEYTEGDANFDGEFSIADAVSLQNYLIGRQETGLVYWKAADLCDDNRLDVFDMCLMRSSLTDSSQTSESVD